MRSTIGRGCFITFEGVEGAGKSTQVARLAASLRGRGYHVLTTLEPGATALGIQLRQLIMHPTEGCSPSPLTELFLYLADRAQHLHEVIRPAIARGEVVLCDRFSGSTIAYQGYGRGLDRELVVRLDAAARAGGLPDLTILLDYPVEDGLRRASGDDRLQREPLAFHLRVQEGFSQLAANDPRWVTIPSTPPVDAVSNLVLEAVLRANVLPELPECSSIAS